MRRKAQSMPDAGRQVSGRIGADPDGALGRTGGGRKDGMFFCSPMVRLHHWTAYSVGRRLSYLGLTHRLDSEIGGWPHEHHGQIRRWDTCLSYARSRGVPLKKPAWIYA